MPIITPLTQWVKVNYSKTFHNFHCIWYNTLCHPIKVKIKRHTLSALIIAVLIHSKFPYINENNDHLPNKTHNQSIWASSSSSKDKKKKRNPRSLSFFLSFEAMMERGVTLEVGNDGVAIIAFYNPPVNALAIPSQLHPVFLFFFPFKVWNSFESWEIVLVCAVLDGLQEKFAEAVRRDDVKAIVLTGNAFFDNGNQINSVFIDCFDFNTLYYIETWWCWEW